MMLFVESLQHAISSPGSKSGITTKDKKKGISLKFSKSEKAKEEKKEKKEDKKAKRALSPTRNTLSPSRETRRGTASERPPEIAHIGPSSSPPSHTIDNSVYVHFIHFLFLFFLSFNFFYFGCCCCCRFFFCSLFLYLFFNLLFSSNFFYPSFILPHQ